jgi:hypothetical protein
MAAEQHWGRCTYAVVVAIMMIGHVVRYAAAAPPTATTNGTSMESTVFAAYSSRKGVFSMQLIRRQPQGLHIGLRHRYRASSD